MWVRYERTSSEICCNMHSAYFPSSAVCYVVVECTDVVGNICVVPLSWPEIAGGKFLHSVLRRYLWVPFLEFLGGWQIGLGRPEMYWHVTKPLERSCFLSKEANCRVAQTQRVSSQQKPSTLVHPLKHNRRREFVRSKQYSIISERNFCRCVVFSYFG